MPMSDPAPTVHPWTTARWPMVHPSPTRTGKSGSEWRTAPSWTLLPAPTTIGEPSARMTAAYQTLASAATCTAPTRVAPSATKASGATSGVQSP